MKKQMMKLLQAFILIALLAGISCSKNDKELQPDDENTAGLIDSLVTRIDTIRAIKDTTSITVYTNKPDVKIQWSTDHGTILGGGKRIVYYSGECCVGDNTVTCRVTSDTQSSEKSVRIHVKSYFEER
jgi:hypothetical protein